MDLKPTRAYPNLLGKKGYVVVVAAAAASMHLQSPVGSTYFYMFCANTLLSNW